LFAATFFRFSQEVAPGDAASPGAAEIMGMETHSVVQVSHIGTG